MPLWVLDMCVYHLCYLIVKRDGIRLSGYANVALFNCEHINDITNFGYNIKTDMNGEWDYYPRKDLWMWSIVSSLADTST